jgi:hypothetical protein
VPSESSSASGSEIIRRRPRKSSFRAAVNMQAHNFNNSGDTHSSSSVYASRASQSCVDRNSSDISKGLFPGVSPFPNPSEIKKSRPSEKNQHKQTDDEIFTSVEMILVNFKMQKASEGQNDRNPTMTNKNKSHHCKELNAFSFSSTIASEENNSFFPSPPKGVILTEVASEAESEAHLKPFSPFIKPNTKGDDSMLIKEPAKTIKEAIVRVGLRDVKRKTWLMHFTGGKSKNLQEDLKMTRWRNILLSGRARPNFSVHSICSIIVDEDCKGCSPLSEIQVEYPGSLENVSAAT